MFQLYKNVQTDFLGQIFLELFQFKTQSLFWDTQQSKFLWDLNVTENYSGKPTLHEHRKILISKAKLQDLK